MDLGAFANTRNALVSKYIEESYGDVPRLRGVRFMKVESVVDEKPNVDVLDIFNLEDDEAIDYTEEIDMFNKYVGEDVIYIHTRCGDCGMGYDSDSSNFVYCGAKDWEEKYKDLFLDHITEPFDTTYCTHYFKAVINDDYNKILQYAREANDSEEDILV
jgi:hypothetical protein